MSHTAVEEGVAFSAKASGEKVGKGLGGRLPTCPASSTGTICVCGVELLLSLLSGLASETERGALAARIHPPSETCLLWFIV